MAEQETNQLLKEQYPILEMYQALREQLLDMIDDEDLSFALPGNPSLGQLCAEIGEIERAYIESFRTFEQHFDETNNLPDPAPTIDEMRSQFESLDAELRQVVSELDDETIQNRKIDRGHGFELSPRIQLEVYKEALLIFYGKCTPYLRALNKDRTEQWREWIG